MDSFNKHLLQQEYRKLAQLGDKLAAAEQQINWEKFRPILADLYMNDTERRGRPNHDTVVMVKLLVLQQWYGLSDEETERQAVDRLSFRRFLGYTEKVPDSTTIWLFREKLAETGKDKQVWDELQKQLDIKGLKIRKVWRRTYPSSRLTRAHQTSQGERRLRPGEAGMVTGRSVKRGPCMGISCM
jgi:IS5 family transposase